MKKIMQYTEEKFNSFSDEKKIRVIISFIIATDRVWPDECERVRLLSELKKCLYYCRNAAHYDLKAISVMESDLLELSHTDFISEMNHFVKKYGTEPKDHDLIIPERKKIIGHQTVPLFAVLENLRSAFNVGSIIRTSECFGISKVYMCGYTPTPENIKVKKTAMKTEERVLWERRDDLPELMDELRGEGIELIALETGSQAQPLHSTPVNKPAAIFMGNEAYGLSDLILKRVDRILKIPLMGEKESFNVGVAYGIACYEILRKWNML